MAPIIHLDRNLAQRLEAADAASNVDYVQTKQRLLPESGCALRAVGDGIAIFSGADSPISGVFQFGMAASVSAALLAEVEAFFAACGAPSQIHVCPLADPSLFEGVRQRSYRLASFKHVWAQRLEKMDESPQRSVAVTVSEASEDQRLLWAQVVSYAFEGSGSLADANTDIAWPNANKTNTRCFIAWIGGEPTGGGALAIHDGVAICFSTSIHPIFRRMGAQTALLHARLHAARWAGCDLALVQTTPGGASQRNVEKAGFRLAYTRATLVR